MEGLPVGKFVRTQKNGERDEVQIVAHEFPREISDQFGDDSHLVAMAKGWPPYGVKAVPQGEKDSVQWQGIGKIYVELKLDCDAINSDFQEVLACKDRYQQKPSERLKGWLQAETSNLLQRVDALKKAVEELSKSRPDPRAATAIQDLLRFRESVLQPDVKKAEKGDATLVESRKELSACADCCKKAETEEKQRQHLKAFVALWKQHSRLFNSVEIKNDFPQEVRLLIDALPVDPLHMQEEVEMVDGLPSSQLQERFKHLLEMQFERGNVPSDGNCLPRALANAIKPEIRGNRDLEDAEALKMRAEIADYMGEHRDLFEPFCQMLPAPEEQAEDKKVSFDEYLAEIRKSGTYLGNQELRATAELYERCVYIFAAGSVEVVGNSLRPRESHILGQDFAEKIYLYHQINHYSYLVPK